MLSDSSFKINQSERKCTRAVVEIYYYFFFHNILTIKSSMNICSRESKVQILNDSNIIYKKGKVSNDKKMAQSERIQLFP